MFADLRFAARVLLKSPAYTLVSILALALGISTATSQFTFFNAIVLRPMPGVKDEGRLVRINSTAPRTADGNLGFSEPNFLDVREQSKTLEGGALTMNRTVILSGGEKPERVLGASISAAGLDTVGVQPILGRNFRPEEDKEGCEPVAVIGFGFWQRSFGGNKSIIGQSATFNGESVTIVGVMPEGFGFPSKHEVWMPYRYNAKEHKRSELGMPFYARLKPGVTLGQAQAELDVIAANLAKTYPATNEGIGFRATPMRDNEIKAHRRQLYALLGSVVFVLLIACANVANLMLAKAATRSREVAIRTALGAGRPRIIRQVLTEGLLLGVVGGGLGVILSMWSIDLIRTMIPEPPFWVRFELDWRVMIFAVIATLFSSALFALLPAMQASQPDLSAELKEGGRVNTGSAETLRLRGLLVVAQVALALILLVGAGLMMRSFMHLQNAKQGFDADNLLTFRVGLPPEQYTDENVVRAFWSRLRQNLRALPGVEDAAFIGQLPAAIYLQPFQVEGQPDPTRLTDSLLAVARTASPGILKTLKIPLIRGRFIEETDSHDAPRVVVVDQDFAEQTFPGVDAIGKRLSFGPPGQAERKWCTIVGIVGNIVQSPTSTEQQRAVWFPMGQEEGANFASGLVRIHGGNPMDLLSRVQDAVFAAQENIPIYDAKPMTDVVADLFWEARIYSRLFISFALTALFLAAIGIYGVMAYSVTQRTQEIGLRMALGSPPDEVIKLFLRQGLRLVAAGLALGFAGAWFVAHLLQSFLYGVSPHDPPTFALVPLLLAAVAILACWLPSRRATRIDPNAALRA
jgi:putative ABC transport system permease protein